MKGLLSFLKIVYFRHRNSQKRIIFEDACYFVTSKTYGNYPYFRERIFCDLFVESLKLCKKLKGFLLYGWVLNYDHFHLLVQPSDEYDISKVMQFLKRHVSRNINIIMDFKKISGNSNIRYTEPSGGDIQSAEPSGGDIGQCRLRNGEDIKVINDIHKFDIFVLISKIRFTFKYLNKNPFPKFRWQRSFFDEYMRNENEFNNFIDYISYNPEKHELPNDWPYIFTNEKCENLTD